MASYFPMVKNTGQRIVFPILDADGDPVTGAAADTPDSEYSLDGGSFADIADEIHEIATVSGVYYLDLAAGETNGDVVCIQVKTATAGTKTTVLVFYTAAQSLDTMDTNIDDIETDTNELQGLIANSKIAAQVKGIDNIDFGATMKTSLETAVDDGLDNAIGASPAADSVAQRVKAIDLLTEASGSGDLAAVLADTDELQGNQGNWATATGFATSGALATHDGKLDTVDTVVDGIQTDLSNATDGLGALKDLIDTVDGVVDDIKAKTDLLPSGVPKNVALSNLSFLMVLSSDHISPATGKTITAEISKDGGAFAACNQSVAEVSNGVYTIDLIQAEMNADVITLKFTETDCDQRTLTIVTST